MNFLLSMVIFQPAMLVYRRVRDLLPQIPWSHFFAGLLMVRKAILPPVHRLSRPGAPWGVPLRWFDGRMVQGSPLWGVSEGLKRPEKKRLFGDAIIGLFFCKAWWLVKQAYRNSKIIEPYDIIYMYNCTCIYIYIHTFMWYICIMNNLYTQHEIYIHSFPNSKIFGVWKSPGFIVPMDVFGCCNLAGNAMWTSHIQF